MASVVYTVYCLVMPVIERNAVFTKCGLLGVDHDIACGNPLFNFLLVLIGLGFKPHH